MMLRKLLVITICLSFLLQIPASAAAAASPTPSQKVIYGDFVDLNLTLGLKEFSVYAMKKQFYYEPFADGNVTFVQMDVIAQALGFTTKYDPIKKILTAKSTTQSFVVKAGSYSYLVNGKAQKFLKPPREKSGILMVPVEELFISLGYKINKGKPAKAVRITKFKDINLGSFVIYNKNVNNYNFYSLNKNGISAQIYKDVDIIEMYSYSGMILGYVYDRLQRYNKLVLYENSRFQDLMRNFDVVDSFEFGSNRVFYGYDNTDKKYKLFRFDGRNLILVADDCFSSVHIKFNNNIILNKYDSNRNYSIIKIDQYWNISELDSQKTIKEYFISDNWLYIKARPQEGTGLSFLVFNGTSVIKVKAPDNLTTSLLNLDFSKIRICNGKIYAILPEGSKNRLFRFDESTVTRVLYESYDANITLMEAFNGKLYLSANYSYGGSARYIVYEYSPDTLMYRVVDDVKLKNKNFAFDKSLVEEGTLFLTGRSGDVPASPSEQVIYAYRNGIWNYAMDISSINSVIKTGNGLYLKVTDFDRATNASRNSIIFMNNDMGISNAAIDFTVTNQAVIGNSFIFAGANKITNRSAVSSHDNTYHELIRGFTVNYWNAIDDKVFTGGTQDSSTNLYRITGTTATIIKENFDTQKVLSTQNPNLYLVYGNERDSTTVYYGNQVLYLYDVKNSTFTLIAVGIQIEQILRIN